MVFAATLLISPVLAFAAPEPGAIVSCTGATGEDPCTICDIGQTAQNILNTGIFIAIFFSAVMFAYAGWKYMTAGGEGGKSAGKEIFTNVLIGLVIILAGWLVIDTIMKTLVKDNGGFGPWNEVCTTSPGRGPDIR